MDSIRQVFLCMLSTVWFYSVVVCIAVYILQRHALSCRMFSSIVFNPKIKLAQNNSLHCSDCHLTLIDTVQARYNIESYFRNLKRKRFFTSLIKKTQAISENLHFQIKLLYNLVDFASKHKLVTLSLSKAKYIQHFYCGTTPSLGILTIFSRFYTWVKFIITYFFFIMQLRPDRKSPKCDSVAWPTVILTRNTCIS